MAQSYDQHKCSSNQVNYGNKDGPSEVGCEVLTPRVHGLPVQLRMLHHCAALHILSSPRRFVMFCCSFVQKSFANHQLIRKTSKLLRAAT